MIEVPIPSSDGLRIARATAIEQYAELEGVLCVILANLLRIRHDDAAVIFYATTSADVRNRIIKTFIERVHSDFYSAYFQGTSGEKKKPRMPGMWNLISNLDTERHRIVHWVRSGTASVNLATGETEAHMEYRPAYHATRLTDLSPIRTSDLEDFIARATFVSVSLEMFARLIAPKVTLDPATVQTWQPIFQLPPSYPPPEGHPVLRLMQARGVQPPASRG